MENVNLVDATDRTAYFQQGVVANVRYWQDWVAGNLADVTATDQERGNILKAITFALNLDKAWVSVRDLILAFSPYMERRGYWDPWSRILYQAIEVARQVEDTAAKITLSVLLARVLSQQGRIKEAIAVYRRTIYAARKINDTFNEARACTNLGYYYVEQGHWYRAEVLCCYALELFERIDNNHGRAHTANHLGCLYIRQRLWRKAKQHLERACKIWQAEGDHHGLMRGSINLGVLCNEMGSPDESLYHLRKAHDEATLTGDETELGSIYENIGVAYNLKGKPIEAENYFWKAEKFLRRSVDSVKLARLWHNLGLACFHHGRWREGATYLKTALEMCQASNNIDTEIRILMSIVENEDVVNNWPQAPIYLSRLKGLIRQHPTGALSQYLEQWLAKYHHSLTKYLSDQAAVDYDLVSD